MSRSLGGFGRPCPEEVRELLVDGIRVEALQANVTVGEADVSPVASSSMGPALADPDAAPTVTTTVSTTLEVV